MLKCLHKNIEKRHCASHIGVKSLGGKSPVVNPLKRSLRIPAKALRGLCSQALGLISSPQVEIFTFRAIRVNI